VNRQGISHCLEIGHRVSVLCSRHVSLLWYRKEIEYEKLQKSIPDSEEEQQIKARLAQLDKEINTIR